MDFALSGQEIDGNPLVLRPCAGCGCPNGVSDPLGSGVKVDDHPRVQIAVNGKDELFHGDCVPAFLHEAVGADVVASHPIFTATKAGKRGMDVHKAIGGHRRKLEKAAAEDNARQVARETVGA